MEPPDRLEHVFGHAKGPAARYTVTDDQSQKFVVAERSGSDPFQLLPGSVAHS
jgi:hypothetical protein